MSFLEAILTSQDGAAIGQIAKQLGLPEPLAREAAGALAPALARGLQRNAGQPGGLDSLLSALGSGSHQRYVDQPESLTAPEAIEEGNKILGHILGSKDVSRNVAGAASANTGIGADVLKMMLPMLADVAMGTLSKQTDRGQQLKAGAGQANNPLGALAGILDTDKDGDPTDDLLNLAKKFF